MTALIFFCGFYRYEAFVNTIGSSSRVQKLVDQSSTAPITRPYTTHIQGFHNRNNHRGDGSDERFSRSRGRARKNYRSFTRKPRNDVNDKAAIERRDWLRKATEEILEKEPGTLNKGKWHELVSMVKAWSKFSKIDPEAPVVMEKLIKRLHDERIAGNEEAVADIDLYNTLLDAWCCVALFPSNFKGHSNAELIASPATASRRARDILVQLQDNYEYNGVFAKPNEQSFGLVYDVIFKVEGAYAAREFLAWIEEISGCNEQARLSYKYYMKLLHAFANSGDENAGYHAEELVRHMERIELEPDTICYNIALKAWTKAKRGRESAEHADRILEEMPVPRDLITYSTVIHAWSRSGMSSHAVVRAEQLLREVVETPELEPNNNVLNSVMLAWVNSKNPATVNRTTELLEFMEGSAQARPNLFTYNTYLRGLSMHSHKVHEYAERAADVLSLLEEKYKRGEINFRPNLFSYNVVIEALCRSQSPDAPWDAAKLLRGFMNSDSKYKPDTISFNQVFTGLSRSKKEGSTQLAENLLNYMEIAHKNGIFRNAKSDVVSYTSIIVALARSGEIDAAERGEKLLNRMKEHYESGRAYMKPTRVIYNTLISAWANSGKGTYGARKAEALLMEMEEMCAMGDKSVTPTVLTYNSVVDSWAQSGTRCAGNMAVKYLDRMTMFNSTEGEIQIRPNGRTFNSVINAIAKSDSETKAQRSLRILRRMDKLYQSGNAMARPNAKTYTSVLNAAAFPSKSMDMKTKRKTLDTAIFTLQELQSGQYDNPTELTYSTFIRACDNLLSTEDEDSLREVIKETFHQCKEDGQVGEMFLSELKEAAPEDLYHDLFSEVVVQNKDSIEVDDLPLSWRCNV